MKHVLRSFVASWKPRRTFGFWKNSRADQWKPETQSSHLHENKFYFFYKIIIFHFNKEKDDIQSAYVYFSFFHEAVNSVNLETANHIAHVIFLLHSAMKTHIYETFKTHLIYQLFYNTHSWINGFNGSLVFWHGTHVQIFIY